MSNYKYNYTDEDLKDIIKNDLIKTPISEFFTYGEVIKSQIAIRRKIANIPSISELKNAIRLANLLLDRIRKRFGYGYVSSWFRNRAVNKLVGGSVRSQHLTASACDVEFANGDNYTVAMWIKEELKGLYDQLILEFYTPGKPDSGWIHLSNVSSVNRGHSLQTKDGTIFNIL